MDPHISIVVPSRGRLARLVTLLNCLDRQVCIEPTAFEVVVGLDGHDERDAESLPRDFAFDVRYLPLPPVGISAAKNAAVAASRGDVLLFVNDDIEPAPQFLAAHATAQAAGHRVVLGASPFVRFDDQTTFDELVARSRMIFFYAELIPGASYDFRYAWNLNLAVHRDLIDRLDYVFSDGLRPVFYDDVEFAQRLIGDREGVHYCADAFAPHRHRYTFEDYFQREALLGVMSTSLSEVNPACHRAIFRAPLSELASSARTALEIDVPDERKMLAQFAQASAEPATEWTSCDKTDVLYALHLPLKRRAFRSGLVAALDQPETPWTQRIALARDALCADPVFSRHTAWTAEPTLKGELVQA